ncbi:MAG: sugar ABC transporter permease [Thermosphaera sp.]
MSFHEVKLTGQLPQLSYNQLDNYLRVFRDPIFWAGLSNVFLILCIQVPIMTLLALMLALLLNSPLILGKKLFRSIIYFPITVSLVLAAIFWSYMYGKDFGLINLTLSSMGLQKVGWLVDKSIALYSIMNVITWRWTGWNMLLFLAGLQAIPEELYEAAKIDGAGRFQIVRRISLPLIKPVLIFSIVLSINGSLQTFAEPWVLTGGGPAYSTYTVVLNIYRYMFGVGDMGLAAAMSLTLGLITIVTAVTFIRVTKW